jgi:hypothetical protein
MPDFAGIYICISIDFTLRFLLKITPLWHVLITSDNQKLHQSLVVLHSFDPLLPAAESAGVGEPSLLPRQRGSFSMG